jgi:hypothetical protein
MNTGLQDAFDLVWKLAYAIQGKTTNNSEQLLQTYNDERIAIAKNVVNSTDRMFAFTTSANPVLRFIRLMVLPFIVQFIVFPLVKRVAGLREIIFRRLSMINIHYRQSKLCPTAGKVSKVVLGGENNEKTQLFTNFVKEYYSHVVKVHQFIYSSKTAVLFHAFGVSGSRRAGACFLVCPDLYIAYCSTTFDIHHFDGYFSKYFCKHAV